MKKRDVSILFSLLFFISCKKDSAPFIYGTVKDKVGCYTNSWLVEIDSPDHFTQPFICSGVAGGTYYNCSNAVFINNPPSEFARSGEKIKFSKWKDDGIVCQSYSLAPHHLQVEDLSRR